jgi:hypothetical protein
MDVVNDVVTDDAQGIFIATSPEIRASRQRLGA